MNEAKLFSRRLQEAMVNHGYEPRPVVIEREFNQRYWGNPITFQTGRRWLRGEAVPTQDRLQVLAEWLEVDPHWLRFGEKLSGSVRQQKKRWDANMTPEERQAIETFLNLPPDKRKIIGEVIYAFATK